MIFYKKKIKKKKKEYKKSGTRKNLVCVCSQLYLLIRWYMDDGKCTCFCEAGLCGQMNDLTQI